METFVFLCIVFLTRRLILSNCHLTGAPAVRLLKSNNYCASLNFPPVSHPLGLPGQGDLVPRVVIEGLSAGLDGGVELAGPLVDGETDPSVLEVDEDVVLTMTWANLLLVCRLGIAAMIIQFVSPTSCLEGHRGWAVNKAALLSSRKWY